MQKTIFLILFLSNFTGTFAQVYLTKSYETIKRNHNMTRTPPKAYITKKDRSIFKINYKDDNITVSINENGFLHLKSFDSLNFQNVIFDGPLYLFNYAPLFTNNVSFINTKFTNDVILSRREFKKPVNFSYSIFPLAFFDNCVFDDKVEFRRSLFKDTTDSYGDLITEEKYEYTYEKVKPVATASFANTVFKGKVSFVGAEFGHEVNLSNSEFYHIPRFDHCILPDILNLSNINLHLDNIADINSKIDFRYSNLTLINKPNSIHYTKSDKCKIKLTGTAASKLILPFELFTLDFSEDITYEEKTSTYEGIINSCKVEGMTESAQNWDIEYRKLQIKHDWPLMGGFIINFNEHWWNFGYEKWRILVGWLPSIFLLFFLLNIFIIKWLYRSVYQDNEIGKIFARKEDVRPMLNRLSYRVSYTLFYTAVIYFGLKLRHESVNYKNFFGLFYLYLMYIVGAIHVAFSLSYILSAY